MKAGEHLELLVERVRWLSVAVGAMIAVVLAGYWFAQLVKGSHYRQLADNNRLRQAAIKAPRGLIVDRHGRRLVENMPSYNLLLDRSRAADLTASTDFAARVLGREASVLVPVLERYRETPGFVPVLIAEDLGLGEVARFEVAALEYPEFQIEVRHRRLYRHGAHTAHLLGYLGEVSESELEAGPGPDLAAGDLVGKEGVEEAYDELLRGSDGGEVLVVDSRGRLVERLRSEPARPGQEITLAVDLGLQQEAVHLMADRVGAVVALDPRSGEIRAMVSAPSFDPNRFARRLRRQEWYDILSEPHQALQNRAIHNTYPPGSVFKVVLAIAGLSEGVFEPEQKIWCAGEARFFNRRRRCWLRGGHGNVDFHQAIKSSCDIYFYRLGQELGIDTIARYARRFGLGVPSGVDIAGERSGLVPDSAWSLRERGSPWYPGETISVAIGQGPLLVTPLQMAVLMAAVANGGSVLVPHLVPAGERRSPSRIELDPAALAAVRDALVAVVNDDGSGYRARLHGVTVAGKTGTAQVIQQKTWTDSDTLPYEHRDHAWFVSYAPAERPELVVAVLVEHGGHGSRSAASIAKALYEKYFESRRKGPRRAT